MLHKKLFVIASIVGMMLMLSISASAQDKVQIRWFVGLGAGSDAPTFAAQEAVVAEFNSSQDEIEIVLEIIDNDQAFDVLATQIAAGNAPDIVGPMGIRGRESFPGVWLDLTPYIEATDYDLSDFDPALVEFYRVPEQGQLGLPFAVFPSATLYNKDLFDEAGIPYPPSEYGEPYIDWDGNEREWDLETVREIAMILTVDSDGYDATMEEFNPEDIVQFGYGVQMTDVRGRDTLFGAGNFVDEDGNAIIPDHWRVAENWIHDAMWEDYFWPNGVYGNSELMGGGSGNWFGTGNIGMVSGAHMWLMGWGQADLQAEFDFAPVPAYNGVTTAKLHADTFSILESTDHPEEAFEVLSYLLGEKSGELSEIYGGAPARISLQDTFIESFTAGLAEAYPHVDWAGLNWDTMLAGLGYPDNPNHEDGLPAFQESSARYVEYGQLVDNNPDVDVDAELDQLQADLQAIFDAADN